MDLSFDDRLELGLADLDDLLNEQTSLLEDSPAPAAEAPKPPVVSEQRVDAPVAVSEPAPTFAKATVGEPASKPAPKAASADSTAPLCYNCGNQTQRAGSCYVCSSCGSTTGCS
jgi:ribonucleoside-diphosphate reductase alpha chain